MSLAAGIDRRPATHATRTLGTLASTEVARDIALLIGICLGVGLTVGVGMMLAVLALA